MTFFVFMLSMTLGVVGAAVLLFVALSSAFEEVPYFDKGNGLSNWLRVLFLMFCASFNFLPVNKIPQEDRVSEHLITEVTKVGNDYTFKTFELSGAPLSAEELDKYVATNKIESFEGLAGLDWRLSLIHI